jgi:putative NIF3 family GTP cyclohydrolase 1 type 2
MADWLCDLVTASGSMQAPTTTTTAEQRRSSELPPNPWQTVPSQEQQPQATRPPLPPRPAADITSLAHARATLYPNASPPEGFEDAGVGRLVTFDTPQPLITLIKNIKQASGASIEFPIAFPQTTAIEDIVIRTVATCPGSGSSILIKNGIPAADLLLTGELSHHDALAAIERGSVVITLFHSNSERGYLRRGMQPNLARALPEEWARVREDMAQWLDAGSKEMEDLLDDGTVEVEVSQVDRDPYMILNIYPE